MEYNEVVGEEAGLKAMETGGGQEEEKQVRRLPPPADRAGGMPGGSEAEDVTDYMEREVMSS